MSLIACQMNNITLARDHEFELRIPDLSISTQGRSALYKLPFMGESGAGKSTLLNIMAAIEWPDHGTVSWTFPDETMILWSSRGPSVRDARLLRRKYFGFAFQDSTLLPHLRVCDNLCYPLLFTGASKKNATKAAWDALDRVLLDDEKKYKKELFQRFPSKLSGGQRQRIALVQAMIHNPYVLFADEPTGSLDRITRKQVMDVLYEWVEEPNFLGKRLLLWVTHHENDPLDAEVNKIISMKSGICHLLPFTLNRRQNDLNHNGPCL